MRVRSFLDHKRRPAIEDLAMRASCAGAPEKVFAAWSESGRLKRWVGGADFSVSPSFRHLHQDGNWSLQVKNPKRRMRSWFGGVVLGYDTSNFLKFSMACQDPIEVSSLTIVTVYFKPIGDRTLVELHQVGFGSESERRAYRMLWSSALCSLRKCILAQRAQRPKPAFWSSVFNLTALKDRNIGKDRAIG